ncbi:hypothetical protein LENIMA164B_08175 [Lelliottia nimipressuralis]
MFVDRFYLMLRDILGRVLQVLIKIPPCEYSSQGGNDYLGALTGLQDYLNVSLKFMVIPLSDTLSSCQLYASIDRDALPWL